MQAKHIQRATERPIVPSHHNAKRLLLLELEAMKNQEDLDVQLAAKKLQTEIRMKQQ